MTKRVWCLLLLPSAHVQMVQYSNVCLCVTLIGETALFSPLKQASMHRRRELCGRFLNTGASPKTEVLKGRTVDRWQPMVER